MTLYFQDQIITDMEGVRLNFEQLATMFPLATANIADDSVTTAKLAAASVTAAKQAATPAITITKAAQVVGNAAFVPATFDTFVYDNAGDRDLANNRIKVTTAGVYVIAAYTNYVINATGLRLADITVNGSVGYGAEYLPANGLASTLISVNAHVKLAVNDTIGMTIYQNSGGNLNCDSRLSAAWVSP